MKCINGVIDDSAMKKKTEVNPKWMQEISGCETKIGNKFKFAADFAY